MSRKFSDSEIRAYTKNRHEEKMLRSKLGKLKMDISSFHDTTVKQRQGLVAECKDIRMTSGGSPVPKHVLMDTDFDISKRVQRPWAYSVMETTYNAVYRDAVIPLPKQKRGRPKSMFSQRGFTPRSLVSSMETKSMFEQSLKGSTPNKLISIASASDSVLRVSDDGATHMNRQLSSQSAKVDTTVTAGSRNVNGDVEHSKSVPHIVVDLTETALEHNAIETHEIPDDGDTSLRNARERSRLSFALNEDDEDLPTYRSIGAPISLPPMYKIDSQSYQDAERARTLQRSRSRVSFSSNPISITEVPNAGTDKVKKVSPEVPANVETHESGKSNEYDHVPEQSLRSDRTNSDRNHAMMSLDLESFDESRERKLKEVVFKGKYLKNYIHPEDRYKLDPLIMKRRQNKMDKLAKESVSFLKRVNHENINVEIAFPRSARKRILLKLVEENNSVKGRRVNDENGPLIQKKVDYFMNSISDYIRQQQFEREQTFT